MIAQLLVAPPAIDVGKPGFAQLAAPTIGFLMGGLFLWLVDHPTSPAPGPADRRPRASRLTGGAAFSWSQPSHAQFSRGLAVGVAFGAVAAGLPAATLAGAVALAIGIGLQNFPEGLAVSMPLRREGLSRGRSFLMGQASGMVEPIAGVLGAASVLFIQALLPYALSFAAGAMIYVVVEELIPESQSGSDTHMSTWGAMLGFTVMMLLDVALG